MTSDVIKTNKNIKPEEAKKLLHKYRIEKLVVVDKNDHCIGLITVKDIEKANTNPFATKDDKGRLRVGAAIGVGDQEIERALELEKAGADILFIDTAHGHSKSVLEMVSKTKKRINIDIVVGNIATTEAALSLIDSGASAVKVGIGPGSICTTRVVTGVGIPQLSAVMETFQVAKKFKIPVIADGGIKTSGDIAKAIAGGASACMIGSLFAGTEESPGKLLTIKGKKFKSYRGMGSVGAMQKGSFDRYSQEETKNAKKLVAEGVEGMVPYKGKIEDVAYQLVGGLKSSMGYTGHKTIKKMQGNCKFVFISKAGARESNVHDVIM
jgi:IMP dehydrogenase